MLFLYATLFVILILYILISLKEKSFINVFTPSLFIFIPANYILVIIYDIMIYDIEATDGFYYVYLCYFMNYFIMMLVYFFNYKFKRIKLPDTSRYYFTKKIKFLAVFMILISFIIYLPVLLEFRQYLMQPRRIYELTRGGYGLYYFTSLMFLYLGLVLSFFSFKRKIFFLIFCIYLILAFLHGSKAAIIWGVLSLLLFKVYFDNTRFDIKRVLILGVIFSVVMIFAFYISSIGIDSFELIIRLMAGYSDYTRNATHLIDFYDHYFDDYFYGMLFFEDNVYSRIPRAIYTDKPREFGIFILSATVYPEWFAKNSGEASFGMVGPLFADFGYFTVFVIIILAAVKGLLLKYVVTSFKISKSIFYFVFILFLTGQGFIPIGAGYLIFEHIVLAIFLVVLLQIRFFSRRKTSEVRLYDNK